MNDQNPARHLEIQGHRGARGLLPENTLPGFAATLALGVDTLELDVGISRDGVVMVHHDSTLNPMTTRDSAGEWIPLTERPPISSLDAAQLKTYDVGMLKPDSNYAKLYPQQAAVPGARIPTLNEVIELLHRCHSDHVRLNIEAKLDPENPALTAPPEIFVNLLLQALQVTNMMDRATIQSFDWRVPAHVQTLAPQVQTGYLSEQRPGRDTVRNRDDAPSPWTNGLKFDDFQGSLPRMVKAAGGGIWSPDYRSLGEDALREAHSLGLRVVVWTVNCRDDICRMISMGADGVISDYPDRVREAAQQLGLEVADRAPLVPAGLSEPGSRL